MCLDCVDDLNNLLIQLAHSTPSEPQITTTTTTSECRYRWLRLPAGGRTRLSTPGNAVRCPRWVKLRRTQYEDMFSASLLGEDIVQCSW